MTINIEYGSGQADYINFGACYNAVTAMGAVLEDVNCTCVASHTNNTEFLTSNYLKPNFHEIRFNLNGKTITTQYPVFINSAATNFKGVIKIDNGYLFSDTDIAGTQPAVLSIQQRGVSTSVDDIIFKVHNLLISNHLYAGGQALIHGILYTQYDDMSFCHFLNNRIYITRNSASGKQGIGMSFTGGGKFPFWTTPPFRAYKKIENCAIYGLGTGITGIIHYFSYNGHAHYKNTVSFCPDSTGLDWQYSNQPAGGDLPFLFENCADYDGSLADGSNTVHGVTVNDFVSINPENTADIFKIHTRSKLFLSGTNDISEWNDHDFEGKKRPYFGDLVSIGVHEPNSSIVTLKTKVKGSVYQKQKEIFFA